MRVVQHFPFQWLTTDNLANDRMHNPARRFPHRDKWAERDVVKRIALGWRKAKPDEATSFKPLVNQALRVGTFGSRVEMRHLGRLALKERCETSAVAIATLGRRRLEVSK